MMKAEPGITHHDSQYDALFLVLGKIIGAQHFSSNADKTGLFAFVLFYLFFSFPLCSFRSLSFLTIYMHYSFFIQISDPLISKLEQIQPETNPPLNMPKISKNISFLQTGDAHIFASYRNPH